jgi:hypothetical protein
MLYVQKEAESVVRVCGIESRSSTTEDTLWEEAHIAWCRASLFANEVHALLRWRKPLGRSSSPGYWVIIAAVLWTWVVVRRNLRRLLRGGPYTRSTLRWVSKLLEGGGVVPLTRDYLLFPYTHLVVD